MREHESGNDESPDGFRCLKCGACCCGEGVVWLTDDDIESISQHLGLSRKEFIARYARRIDSLDEIVLIDKDDAAMSCIFLGDEGCVIHKAKPRQCVGFPLTWTREDAMEICEGLQAESVCFDGQSDSEN